MMTDPLGVGLSCLGEGAGASGVDAGPALMGLPRLYPSNTTWNRMTQSTGEKMEKTNSGMFWTVEGGVPGRKPYRRLVTTEMAPAMDKRMI